MNRSAAAAIAALLCLAACSAPAPATHDNPFYLASPNLEASPNETGQSPDRPLQSHGELGAGGMGSGGMGSGEDRVPGSPNGMQNTPDGMPSGGGSMSVGGGGG